MFSKVVVLLNVNHLFTAPFGTIHRFSLYQSTGIFTSKMQSAMTYAWERVLHVRGCVRKSNYVPLALLCSVDATGFRLDKKKKIFTHLNRCVKDAKVRGAPNKNQGGKREAIVVRDRQ